MLIFQPYCLVRFDPAVKQKAEKLLERHNKTQARRMNRKWRLAYMALLDLGGGPWFLDVA